MLMATGSFIMVVHKPIGNLTVTLTAIYDTVSAASSEKRKQHNFNSFT